MFDIGFFELLVIAAVGLFVIGPEKLPETIRTCALWIGRIKRNLLETRHEIEQQLGADEIRRALHNEQVMRNLEKMQDTRSELEARINRWQDGATETDGNTVIEHQTDAQDRGDAEANSIGARSFPAPPAPTADTTPTDAPDPAPHASDDTKKPL